MALIYNATFDSQTRILSLLDKAGNVISSCEVPSKELVDDITKPLTFRATKDGSTVKLVKEGKPSGSFQTSRDGGNTWADYKIGAVIALNTGDEVSFRAKANRTSAQSTQNYFDFIMKGKIEAWHNVMSLYRTNDFATYNFAMRYAFTFLFYECTSLTKAPVLPATTLAEGCYWYMFYRCTSLTQAPALPATDLAENCYYSMFHRCTSLTQAPALPATDLARGCYRGMFYECTSLTKAPVLPVTTLAPSCYQYMFDGCTSLTQAPALPATALANYCYYSMFHRCTSLTQAPALPATTLAGHCYKEMFTGCTSLTEAPELPATTLTEYCYSDMFRGCPSLTKAPALPATALADFCYMHMFEGCTSLTQAPALPATTLTVQCYYSMFYGCTSLNEVRISATRKDTLSLENWLKNVAATGDFYCDPNSTIFTVDSESGIPANWTRHALADYPVTP